MEAAGLGFFMMSAALFATLLQYPGSPLHSRIHSPAVRSGIMAVAMGLTAVAIIYSPWGRRSGAHINPAVTLTFYVLHKIAFWDAVFYILAQFTGGLAGVILMAKLLGPWLADPSVNYVVTVPGKHGWVAALGTEFAMAFGLMMAVLVASNSHRFARFTGLTAGLFVTLYIDVAGPISGMSINPARTVASAVPANVWKDAWIYFVAPPSGMLLAAEAYVRSKKFPQVMCAKLHHDYVHRCIFHCGYAQGATAGSQRLVLPSTAA
jgi:aquaporin Z